MPAIAVARTSRAFPLRVPKSVPLPSITMKPYLFSDSSSSLSASVWNLLSQRYKEVLMVLKGSKSMLTFFSFPSSVRMVPVYSTRPLFGTCRARGGASAAGGLEHLGRQLRGLQTRMRALLYSFSLCCADVMAPSTDCRRKGANRVRQAALSRPGPRAGWINARLSVYSVLDVRCCAKLVRKHGLDSGNLHEALGGRNCVRERSDTECSSN